jgi:hypothetical protein
MGRWLDALRNAEGFVPDAWNQTDKTDKTPPNGVSSVLSVPPGRPSEKNSGSAPSHSKEVSSVRLGQTQNGPRNFVKHETNQTDKTDKTSARPNERGIPAICAQAIASAFSHLQANPPSEVPLDRPAFSWISGAVQPSSSVGPPRSCSACTPTHQWPAMIAWDLCGC